MEHLSIVSQNTQSKVEIFYSVLTKYFSILNTHLYRKNYNKNRHIIEPLTSLNSKLVN